MGPGAAGRDDLAEVLAGVAFLANRPQVGLDELDRAYPGVTPILETWFTHYKGPGELETRGFGTVAEANAILESAIAAYSAANVTAR